MNDVTVSTPLNNYRPADLAAASFLARYQGGTRKTYTIHLRVYFAWCDENGLDPLTIKRPHLEMYARYLEEGRGQMLSSVQSALYCLSGFYRMLVADEVIDKSPMTAVRIPKVSKDESRILGLDRMEMGALTRAARETSPTRAALVALMGYMGLRVSEACSVDIENINGGERGHRVLSFIGKNTKPATVPVPVQVGRILDECAGERTEGPLLVRRDGQRLDRRTAWRWINSLAKRAGITKNISPHSLRHSFVTNALEAGVPLRDVQIAARHADPRQTMYYDRARGNMDRHANYVVAGFLSGVA